MVVAEKTAIPLGQIAEKDVFRLQVQMQEALFVELHQCFCDPLYHQKLIQHPLTVRERFIKAALAERRTAHGADLEIAGKGAVLAWNLHSS